MITLFINEEKNKTETTTNYLLAGLIFAIASRLGCAEIAL